MSRYYDDELAALGCSDGGCIIQPPRGQHTNGGCGCGCAKNLRMACGKDMETWRKFMLAMQRYRKVIDVLASAKLLPEEKEER